MSPHSIASAGTDDAAILDGAPPARDVIFAHGLVGCPDWRHFRFEPHPELPGISILASQDDPSICFTLYAVVDADPEYFGKLHAADEALLASLGVGLDPEVGVYCTLNVLLNGDVTANLLGPIVIDRRRGSGTQVVVSSSPFTTRQLLYQATG